MKISIITPVLNGEKTINDAIKSVTSQSYKDIEYIIVDGGSADGTINTVRAYGDRVSVIISQKDGGIYNAMNKGIRAATGDVIGILNADDMYASDEVLEMVMNRFEAGVDICYGDLEYVKRDNVNKVTRIWETGDISHETIGGKEFFKKLRNGWAIPHPVLFVKKEIYDRIGTYREDFKIAGDYQFELRLFLRAATSLKLSISYIPKMLVKMREGGTSSSSLGRRIRGWRELRRAWRVNGVTPPQFYVLRRVFLKMHQYLLK